MTEVTPQPGYYLVRQVGPQGIRTHLVGKDKVCTCGGSARRRCSHIRAVRAHLESGGDRAPEGTAECIRDSKPTSRALESCPICGASLSYRRNGYWRCSKDNSHYWRWRAEENGGAIKEFLTQPHPVKRGPYYAMTEQERDAFLFRAAQRMHRGGHTPGGNHNEQ